MCDGAVNCYVQSGEAFADYIDKPMNGEVASFTHPDQGRDSAPAPRARLDRDIRSERNP